MSLAPKSAGPPTGTLLIIGGQVTPEIRRKAIELAGGRAASWVVIPTARGGEDYENLEYGLGDVSDIQPHILHAANRERANSDEFVKPLESANAVWFVGGRQYRLVDRYKGTKTEHALRKLLDRGGLIAGSSAGATIQGSYLLRGAPSEENRILMYQGYEEAFGYISNTAIDQHVQTRGRDCDLSAVVARYPYLLGIGIDEGAAVVVKGNTMTVIGENRVLITDGKYYGGNTFYPLSADDEFDLATWQKI
jgi:cyanophycinase